MSCRRFSDLPKAALGNAHRPAGAHHVGPSDFGDKLDILAFPFEEQFVPLSRQRHSVVFDEGSSDSYVQDQRVLTVEESQDWFRQTEALKLAPVTTDHAGRKYGMPVKASILLHLCPVGHRTAKRLAGRS